MTIEDIERQLRQIIRDNSAILDHEEKQQIIEFVDVGEYALALETLCYSFKERELIPLSGSIPQIVAVGSELELDNDLWSTFKHDG